MRHGHGVERKQRSAWRQMGPVFVQKHSPANDSGREATRKRVAILCTNPCQTRWGPFLFKHRLTNGSESSGTHMWPNGTSFVQNRCPSMVWGSTRQLGRNIYQKAARQRFGEALGPNRTIFAQTSVPAHGSRKNWAKWCPFVYKNSCPPTHVGNVFVSEFVLFGPTCFPELHVLPRTVGGHLFLLGPNLDPISPRVLLRVCIMFG